MPFNHAFAMLNSMPHLKGNNQNRPKLSYFAKKIQNFRAVAALPQTSQSPLCRCLALRLSLIMFRTADFSVFMPSELSLLPRFKSTHFHQISLKLSYFAKN